MSVLAIVLIVVVVVLLLLLYGGFTAIRRRERLHAGDRERRIADADRALEQARAEDKGWDRGVIEAAARKAVEEAGFTAERFELVLVDDRPGVAQDRAHLLAVGSGGERRVVLSRSEAGWAAESVE